MGRPSGYTDEIAQVICSRLAEGEFLPAICRDKEMPSLSMVHRWLNSNEEFREAYARARETRAEIWAEQIVEIADTTAEGVRVEETEDGVKTVREDMLGHRRLQVDSRKWILSKLLPKVYGDKVTQEHTGPDGGPVVFKWQD